MKDDVRRGDAGQVDVRCVRCMRYLKRSAGENTSRKSRRAGGWLGYVERD